MDDLAEQPEPGPSTGRLPDGATLYSAEQLRALGLVRLPRTRGVGGFPFDDRIADQVLGLRAQALDYAAIAVVLALKVRGINDRHVYSLCQSRKVRLAAVCKVLGLSLPPNVAQRPNPGGKISFTDAHARAAMDAERPRPPRVAAFVDVKSWLRQVGYGVDAKDGGLFTINRLKPFITKMAENLTPAQVVGFANNLRVRNFNHVPFDVVIDPTSSTAERDERSLTGGGLGLFKKGDAA